MSTDSSEATMNTSHIDTSYTDSKATQQVALVSGASSGIGLELTRLLLSKGYHVIALNRSEFENNEDNQDIHQALQEGRIRIYRADLSDFQQLRAALEQIKVQEQRIDIVFNNAGNSLSQLTLSPQGRELHFELMTVVPYIITMELLPLLSAGQGGTVIHTSSAAFDYLQSFDVDTLDHPTTFRKLIGPYASSKLALTLWARAASSSLAAQNVMIRSVDPGGNNTLRKNKPSGLPLFARVLMKWFMAHPSTGANRLYNGAVGEYRQQTGILLKKEKPVEPRFIEKAEAVWEKVDHIYRQEYLPMS
ncbi:SDR family NAD(P)-dependent oxidoreductase [Paenibacillus sp. WLX2291]|uniref:SDR family NAD(P)-dependent oxidoreductase n=1 Tax=Paenibacillus sp. WLX2291 TaxID=3296934 RepID=UPI0039841ADD